MESAGSLLKRYWRRRGRGGEAKYERLERREGGEEVDLDSPSTSGTERDVVGARRRVRSVTKAGTTRVETVDAIPSGYERSFRGNHGVFAREADGGVVAVAELSVSGMTCSACSGSVEEALRRVVGVQSVGVSLVTGRVDVTFGVTPGGERPEDVLQVLAQTVEDAGFDVDSSSLAADPSFDRPVLQVRLAIQGMTCSSCSSAVESALSGVPGVAEVKVALAMDEAFVAGDSTKFTAQDVVTAIEDAGFEAQIKSVETQKDEGIVHEIEIDVEGMTCSACQNSVEGILAAVKGVESASVSLITGKAKVTYMLSETKSRDIIKAIEDAGFGASVSQESQSSSSRNKTRESDYWRTLFRRSLMFTVPLFLLSKILPHTSPGLHRILMSEVWGVFLPLHQVLKIALATPVQFWIGRRFYVGAYNALRHGSANMDVLVVLGTTASYAYSLASVLFHSMNKHKYAKDYQPTDFFETGATLITFICLGKYLETSAKAKTSNAISKLMELTPDTAILVELDENNQVKSEQEILTTLIHVGDHLKVLPGSKIPTDGTVSSGSSYVDESMITGESIPVLKSAGDQVIGGTLNTAGLLHMKATKIGSDTALSQIIKMVETAQMSKAPVQRYADKISSYFVPIVVILAVTTFLSWYIAGRAGGYPSDWIPQGHNVFLFSLTFGISVVVVACPCALGLATPTAIMVGTGVGATNGVLIKGGDALEKACHVSCLVFDKTGTLTLGLPSVVDSLHLHPYMKEEECAVLAATAESSSEHPLARAILKYARDVLFGKVRDDSQVTFDTPEEVDILPGFGVICTVKGAAHAEHMARINLTPGSRNARNMRVCIGNRKLMQSEGVRPPESADLWMKDQEEGGRTAVMFAVDGAVASIFAIADPLKPEARGVVEHLQAMGIACAMASGDNWRTAQAIGRDVGISDIHAGISPGEKVDVIKEMQRKNVSVGMVGDGVNDSPALVASDVGIALGSGTDIAVEAADYVLMRDNLEDVLMAVDLSKATMRRIKQNYVWAMVYNIVCIPLAGGALFPSTHLQLPPWVAGGAMALSSVSVVCSSLLLHSYRRPVLRLGDVKVT
ncbi:heavy metal transporting ATPase [Chloropicon primus]|uniref:Heavy metal transporting ATPase n=1 Tax=Chloropicon primus TaxID=1764295 RepID=A0A5B8MCH9_9CHLO|nr:heavy metal transporting ATPase [Chloropicon primus]UPQ97292.1 heavy metal transporting ATPase [Chloropicon primus]|eukprot:QDZ18079.1 heavy metal transporting ATPase [Chloropicon primus]